ncbi:hypothetical protein [Clostridium sp. JN-9]|uniref:hypothetical protein n=1 Tax=Clostridium sp. JN-9 TaxID=2507159 RepID=UPI000FFE18E4|nr:hypothetical protein [Clostridium sp. JN-9]QAT41465.1 hypothetical protein EQM05_15045 [Clostridium sp. JN-9]
MKNFIISAFADLILILAAYFIFRSVISGPTRHRLYEKFFSSMSRFIIVLFIVSISVTGIIALILYKTRYISYINIISPGVLSILVGFLMSTVPTRGAGDEKSKQ